MLGLFRRGRIDDAELDKQLDDLDAESTSLQAEIDAISRSLSACDRTAQLRSAKELLETLRSRLSGPLSPHLNRRVVEALVEKIEANTVERWGVQQSHIEITYGFGQPNEPAALVLPRSHRIRTRNRVPDQLNTVGDHLLRRRLVLKLLQKEVAEQIGVDKSSIGNWELNRTAPAFEYMPAIIRFLGYNPIPPPDKWSERLVQCRTVLGSRRRNQRGAWVLTRAHWLYGNEVSGSPAGPTRGQQRDSCLAWELDLRLPRSPEGPKAADSLTGAMRSPGVVSINICV